MGEGGEWWRWDPRSQRRLRIVSVKDDGVSKSLGKEPKRVFKIQIKIMFCFLLASLEALPSTQLVITLRPVQVCGVSHFHNILMKK